MWNIIKPTRLCLSGGGVRTISYLGALQVLKERGLLENINEYLGVSAGALVGFLLCIGYSIGELYDIMADIDFNELPDLDPANIITLFTSDTQFGIDNGEGVVKFFIKLIKIKHFSSDITFADLPANKRLRIFASDLSTLNAREFSAKLTPTVKIIDALRASMSLPFYFTPIRDPLTGNLLTDGAIIGNYPIIHLTPFEASQAIGLVFDEDRSDYVDIKNMSVFFYQIMSCYWINRNKAILTRYAKNTIIIPRSNYSSWNFDIKESDKKFLIESGRTAALKFLDTIHKPTYRRRSVA